MSGVISHVIGIDDAPFLPDHRGDVDVIGAVFCRRRLEGVLRGRVRRDGRNSTAVIARLVNDSRYREHLQCIMLQGIALAGFNVVDLQGLHRMTGLPVAAIARQQPDLPAIRSALLHKVSGGRDKWRLIERAGPMEPLADVYVQRVGLSRQTAEELIGEMAYNSKIPEPLRTAHLIASGVSELSGRQRV
jgi:endonuclease V-like protein UPF0215 family